MKAITIILSMSVAIALSCGCSTVGGNSEKAQPTVQAFVPGDCAQLYMTPWVYANSKGTYFSLHWFIYIDSTKGDSELIPGMHSFYQWPSEDIWRTFEDRSKIVEENFKSLAREMFSNIPTGGNHIVTTVFPIGRQVITANVPIFGIPAGEDLSSLILDGNLEQYPSAQTLDNLTLHSDNGNLLYSELLTNGSLGNGVSIRMNAPDSFDQKIVFTLSVPVRRVLFLEWLNQLQSNPDAPIPYIDEVMEASGTLGRYRPSKEGNSVVLY